MKLNPKLIICEKPICSNINQSKNIVKMIRKKKINLVINHQLRFNKNIILARKLIDKKIRISTTSSANTLNQQMIAMI
jgi:predicted dehydrogenase